MTTLQINETFLSIQGETSHIGRPCFFIRLAGCNLDCAWCDTRYASTEPGIERRITDLVSEALASGTALCSVTGGEPLMQEGTSALVADLCAAGFTVLVETNGSLDISSIAPPAHRMLDMKPPSSGMDEQMDYENLRRLRAGDEVKFVITSRQDYEWAISLLSRCTLPEGVEVLFSCAAKGFDPSDLAEWICADHLPVRMQMQLHRIIWPDQDRGV